MNVQNDVMLTFAVGQRENWVENYFWKLTWRMADGYMGDQFIEDQENFVVDSDLLRFSDKQ